MMKNIFQVLISVMILTISYHANAQEISPRLVGTNAWYNPSQEVWDKTAESGVKTIRIGGHAYDDNLPSKETLLDWVKKIRAMGAEPIIQVSQYQSASVAADLVKYFNVDLKGQIAPIKYWNIGNEPWLQYNNLAAGTDVGTLVETYFKPIAAAMKAVDPTIKIFGPDFCYYVEFAINDLFGGKNDIAGKVPGKDYYYCDGISWHRYPQDANINLAYQGIDDFETSIIKCKQKVDEVNASHNRTGDNALQWGIGEFNAKGGPQVHTWENGQMFGGVLGLCMKYGATYACSWSMFESSGNRGSTDFSLFDGANLIPRASYWHMDFVAKYFKGTYLDGNSSSNDFVVYGAQDGNETAVMIMHRGADSTKEYTLHLNNPTTTGSSVILNVNAGLDQTYSDLITPRTTQVLIFKGDSITKINYSSKDFDNGLPPVFSKFKQATALPDKPTGLQVTPVSFNRVQLSWNDQSDNEQGFIVERQGPNGFEIVSVLPADSTSYTDGNLLPSTSYVYRVCAYNSFGNSDYSDNSTGQTTEKPSPVAYNGPHSIPGITQAEDFDDNQSGVGYYDTDTVNQGGAYRTTGVDIESCTDTGGGYNVGYIKDGEWLTYLIEDVTPGTYTLSLRLASDNSTSDKGIDVYLGDTKEGSVTPVYTGGWQVWQTIDMGNVEVSSSEPVQLTLKFSGESYNLNWFEFSESTLSIDHRLNGDILAYYNKTTHHIIVTVPQDMSDFMIHVVNLHGQTIYQTKQNNSERLEINASKWSHGIYLIAVSGERNRYTCKLSVN